MPDKLPRTHADLDALAVENGIVFPNGATVAEKQKLLADSGVGPVAETEVGYVLPEEAVAASDPKVLPGFPGVWLPGEPIPISMLGLDEEEIDRRIEEDGLPLVKVDAVDAPPADFLDRTGGILSGADLDSGPEEITLPDAEPVAEAPPVDEQPQAELVPPGAEPPQDVAPVEETAPGPGAGG